MTTKIFRGIACYDDHASLQVDVESLVACGDVWGLNCNDTKCKAIIIGNTETRNTWQYTMGNKVLSNVNEILDLAVLVDRKIRWDSHIHEITKGANRKMCLFIRKLGY